LKATKKERVLKKQEKSYIIFFQFFIVGEIIIPKEKTKFYNLKTKPHKTFEIILNNVVFLLIEAPMMKKKKKI